MINRFGKNARALLSTLALVAVAAPSMASTLNQNVSWTIDRSGTTAKYRVVAYGDLGMEAIYEFDVRDMPDTVAVDAAGTSVHNTAPAQWSEKIRTLGIPVRVA